MAAPTDCPNAFAACISLRAASRYIPKRELKVAVVEGTSMLKQAISSRDKEEKQYQRTEGKLAVAKETIRATRVNLMVMKHHHKTTKFPPEAGRVCIGS
jgi:hypothetical protein